MNAINKNLTAARRTPTASDIRRHNTLIDCFEQHVLNVSALRIEIPTLRETASTIAAVNIPFGISCCDPRARMAAAAGNARCRCCNSLQKRSESDPRARTVGGPPSLKAGPAASLGRVPMSLHHPM
jgi:hypothetical protein